MTATAGDAAGAVAGFAAGLGYEPKIVAVLFIANFLKSGKA
jgi:phage shock protein PspC (stress-responsive transcriptional regulator)